MMRTIAATKTVVVTLAVLGVVTLAMPSIGSADKTIVVTSTIQAAVDAAKPGDTIVVPPGTYLESVLVNKDNLTIVGGPDAIIDAGLRIGIRVGAGVQTVVDGVTRCPEITLKNFTLKGLTIRNARFAGVFVIGVNGFRLTETRYLDNPIYGPFPRCSRNGLVDHNYVEGGSASPPDAGIDAGIYVGLSRAVTIRDNFVTNYAIGIEVENSSRVTVRDNTLVGNTTGILAVVGPLLDQPFTEDVLITGNDVIRNNLPNPVAADSGDSVGLLPTGTGILNVGSDRVRIRNNRVFANDSVGVAIIENPFAPLDPRIEPNPDGNVVRRNVILRNGRHPDPVRATTPGVDIVYDESGVGNCFAQNEFLTEFPPGVTDRFPCREQGDDVEEER